MSLSESQQQLLLSASLDGDLSPEEQSLLERWLREDPAAVAQRDELVMIRQQLRAALRPARQNKLGESFAERIVAAAIEQAQRENLPATHPLVRLAHQSEVEQLEAGGGKRRTWRWAAGCVALAASVLLAIWMGRPLPHGDAEVGPGLAKADPAVEPAEAQAAVASGLPSLDSVLETQERVAAIVGGGDSAAPEPLGSGGTAAAEQVAAAEPLPSDSQLPVERELPGGMVTLSAVMVVSVEMTQQGRDSLALLEALRAADIRMGPAGAVNDQVVSHLRQSGIVQVSEGDGSAKLYFVEAPAKRLDRFLLRLMADKDSFASFGLTITENPPLLASVNNWQPIDPAAVRHADTAAIARDLVFADGTPLAIDVGTAFIPMSLLPNLAAEDSGANNVESQILLLVR